MEIIKGPAHWSKQVTCRSQHCGTELKIEVADVKWRSFGANWGGDNPELGFYVICPSCKHAIKLNENDLPQTVLDAGSTWWNNRAQR